MSTKTSKGTTRYRTITPGKTQRSTAEAIYQYLQDHPEDIPNGKAISNLTFRLQENGPACIQFSDLNGLNLWVFPATTTEIQVERGWTANYGGRIGNGAIIDHPDRDGNNSPPEEIIRYIRIVIGRTLRHHAKEDARVAAQIERRHAMTPDALDA